MDSRFPEIDADGFRNDSAAGTFDIAALGDSQTYGYNVAASATWPRQLARKTGLSVYNFGIGGYGPLHYYFLMDKAIAKGSKYIALGLYLANDLNDVCRLLTTLDYWQGWAKERQIDISPCGASPTAAHRPKQNGDPPELSFLRKMKMLMKRTAIFSIFDYYVWDPLKYYFARDDSEDGVLFKDGYNNTVISLAFMRRVAKQMDNNDDSIRFSRDLTKILLREMAEKAKSHNSEIFVIFIPSKESVLLKYLEEKNYDLPGEFYEVVKREKIWEQDFQQFFERIGVKTTTARPYVVKAVYDSGSVYPFRNDYHPLDVGYQAYAQAAYDAFFVGR